MKLGRLPQVIEPSTDNRLLQNHSALLVQYTMEPEFDDASPYLKAFESVEINAGLQVSIRAPMARHDHYGAVVFLSKVVSLE